MPHSADKICSYSLATDWLRIQLWKLVNRLLQIESCRQMPSRTFHHQFAPASELVAINALVAIDALVAINALVAIHFFTCEGNEGMHTIAVGSVKWLRIQWSYTKHLQF